MLIGGKHYNSIWLNPEDKSKVMVIDQTALPFELRIVSLESAEDAFNAIKNMLVRGAPLIGATAAFGIYLALLEQNSLTRLDRHLTNAARYLASARPTAVNLEWAINRMLLRLSAAEDDSGMVELAREEALKIWSEEREASRMIGVHGLPLIEEISRRKNGDTVNILTHCNAGWLACVDYGTATAPIYLAHDSGIKLHVWVDETRPRNQGSRLTAYELGQHGVPYTLITDNAGGHLMQKGLVDMVITGSDRTALNGDVANKIGTYLKALAAHDNKIPFYVALPTSSIDVSIKNGVLDIPVEERNGEEVSLVEGRYRGEIIGVETCLPGTPVSNYGFDITPARYISGLITEKGRCNALEEEILTLLKD